MYTHTHTYIYIHTHTHTYVYVYTYTHIYIYVLFLHVRSAAEGIDASGKLPDLAVRLMYLGSNCDEQQAEQGHMCADVMAAVCRRLFLFGAQQILRTLYALEQIVQNFMFSGELPKAWSRPYRT